MPLVESQLHMVTGAIMLTTELAASEAAASCLELLCVCHNWYIGDEGATALSSALRYGGFQINIRQLVMSTDDKAA